MMKNKLVSKEKEAWELEEIEYLEDLEIKEQASKLGIILDSDMTEVEDEEQ